MLKQILQEKLSQKAKAEIDAEAFYRLALTIPEFKECEKSISELSYQIAEYEVNRKISQTGIAAPLTASRNDADKNKVTVSKTKQSPNELKINELKLKLAALQKNKIGILKKYNLNIAPAYSCPKCQDTGYIPLLRGVAKGDGTVTARQSLCPCVKKLLSDAILGKTGLGGFKSVTFEDSNFKIFGDAAESQKKIYEKIQKYCAKFPDTNIKTHILSGGTGTGKTHLAACIASETGEKGYDVTFTTAFGLVNLMLKSHVADIEFKEEFLSPALESDLLIIDDLGMEVIYKNVTLDYLYLVFNERLVSGKHTVITTNLTPDEIINRYGERIFSRLMNKSSSAFFDLNSNDLRLQK